MQIYIMLILVLIIIYIIVSFVTAEYFFRAVIVRRNISSDKDSLYADINSFMHRKIITENKDWLGNQNTESVSIASFDGLNLHGIYLSAKSESDKTVICFHGYTGNGADDFASLAKFYHKNGFNVLIVDMRAHGKSEGKYIGFGVLDRYDAIRWIKYVTNRTGKSSKILLHGISMGAATVLMSGESGFPESVRGIVADCGFTNVYEIFSHILKRDYHIPKFPVMQITQIMTRKRAGYGYNDINTVDVLKKIKTPSLFIHGELDDFVPLWMSRKNYQVCAGEKEFLLVRSADHAESYYIDQKEYERTLLDFTEKYF